MNRRFFYGITAAFLWAVFLLSISAVCAQSSLQSVFSAQTKPQTETEPAKKVEVKPSAEDREIQVRLENILRSTQWFDNIRVQVQNGVAILRGEAKTSRHKQWAEDLANKTEDVVAVVNEITIGRSTSWYIQQFQTSLRDQWQKFLHNIPFFVLSMLILFLSWLIARLLLRYTRKTLLRRNFHPLLAEVMGRAAALLPFIIGIYIVLQALGLTTMALTILGGTGIIGIILGIAFRDITENLLASILLSLQNPFHNDDLIQVNGITGFVQALTMRATILLTHEGHEVQIPNSLVYKSNIHNFTSNPHRRENFLVRIDYDNSIERAQEIALNVLQKHPAVLHQPEPLVLVDELGASSVNLRVFFWLNSDQYNERRVTSALLRLVKYALQVAGIVLHEQAVELTLNEKKFLQLQEQQERTHSARKEEQGSKSFNPATVAEGNLQSEAWEIHEQGRHIRSSDKSKNLLTESSKDKKSNSPGTSS